MDARKAYFSQGDFYQIANQGATHYIFSQTPSNQ